MPDILEMNEEIPEIIPLEFVVNISCALCNKIFLAVALVSRYVIARLKITHTHTHILVVMLATLFEMDAGVNSSMTWGTKF